MADITGYVVYQEPPRRPLTARNLEDYALCPQKFLLSFFTPRGQAERFRGGPAALQQAVRAALVECYRQGGPPAVPAERLLAGFEAAWEGSLCADTLEEEQLHAQGRRMLSEYHAQHQAEPVRAIANDLRLEAGIGEHRFVAVADRVDEAEGGLLTLLRYRTAREVPGPRALGREASVALLLLGGEAHFARPAQVGVCAVRRGQLVLAEISDAQRTEWEARLAAQAEALRQARAYPTRVGRHCQVCRSRAQCPAWARPPEGSR